MGRPRKQPAERMSRYVQARMTDDQYGWLAERALLGHEGDVSKALRESVVFAEMFVEILESDDKHAALDEFLERSFQYSIANVELVMDEEPDDAA